MTPEKLFVIVCSVLAVVCYIGYRWCCENVYLKYKEQTAKMKSKKEVKK